MRIEQIDLKIVRLPLVRPFQTSSSRKDAPRPHPGAGRRRRRGRLGRVRQPVRPVLLPRDDRDLLAHPQGLPGSRGPGPGLVDDRRAGRRSIGWSRGTGSPGPGWRWPAGTPWPAREGVPLHALLGGTRPEILSGVSLGIEAAIEALFDQIDRYLDEGYRRIKLKIAPGWDVEVVRQVRERYPDDPAPGRRQLGLHARRPADAPGARRIRPAPDRAAAGPRRHHRPRPAPGRP